MMKRLLIAVGLLTGLVAGCSRGPAAAESDTTVAGSSSAVEIGSALRSESDATINLVTSLGAIKIKLNHAKAPLTVDNFLSQVDNGFYHQTIFHQVEPGYIVLGGGFREDLTEKKGRYSLRNESNNGLSNRRGTIAMARPADGMDSDTAQFFINVADNPALDYQADTPEQCGYCVFGEVIEGMDVVDRIAGCATKSVDDFPSLPVETVLIDTAQKVR